MNTYIDISSKFDNRLFVEVLGEVAETTAKFGIPFFVVGATARDFVLAYGFGLNPGRATADVDIGVRVSAWAEFSQLKEELVSGGETVHNAFFDRGFKL